MIESNERIIVMLVDETSSKRSPEDWASLLYMLEISVPVSQSITLVEGPDHIISVFEYVETDDHPVIDIVASESAVSELIKRYGSALRAYESAEYLVEWGGFDALRVPEFRAKVTYQARIFDISTRVGILKANGLGRQGMRSSSEKLFPAILIEN